MAYLSPKTRKLRHTPGSQLLMGSRATHQSHRRFLNLGNNSLPNLLKSLYAAGMLSTLPHHPRDLADERLDPIRERSPRDSDPNMSDLPASGWTMCSADKTHRTITIHVRKDFGDGAEDGERET